MEQAAFPNEGHSPETISLDRAGRDGAEALATKRVALLRAKVAEFELDLMILDLMSEDVLKRTDRARQTRRYMGLIMTKRTAKEIWQALEGPTVDDEIEAVLAMTPEERRRELFVAGFDLADVCARADALGAASPAEPTVRAATLRQEARDACDAKAWAACLEKLNEARALDPQGDTAADVQAMRRSAEGAHR